MIWKPLIHAAILVCLAAPQSLAADTKLMGSLLIAGNGPEEGLIEDLRKAFEKTYARIFVDIFWHPNAKPVKMLSKGDADVAVTGSKDPDYQVTVIAWDGIAIVSNFSNPIKELTTEQLAGILSGKYSLWSDIWEEAPQARIKVIDREPNQNIRQSLVDQLGIDGELPDSSKTVGPEAQAINEVVGDLSAITYVSITPALRALQDGIGVRLLFINGVEPERPTVRDGRYPLRRPIVLVTKKDPSPVVDAFLEFVLSREGQQVIRSGRYFPIEP